MSISAEAARGGAGAEPADTHWVVLAEADDSGRDRQPARLRRLVVPAVAAAAVVAAVVAIGGWLIGTHIAEQQAVHDVAQVTDVLAQSVVQPALTDDMLTHPAIVQSRLDPVIGRHVLDDSLVRVKLWTPSGAILYSDKSQLIGQRFALDDEAQHALSAARIEAGISDLSRPENRFERSEGKLLEVYRPVWTPNGSPLLFEAYYRYDSVTDRSHQLWRGFGGLMLSSLAALLVLMVPLVWSLFGRARRARSEREALTLRALHASEEERRRIAATLHDGVVQQLAAVSFLAAGTAERAAQTGERELAADLDAVAGAVRDGIAGLRSLLVDIYPQSLHDSGLPAALRDLARIGGGAVEISTDIDETLADSLPQAGQEAVFGVAQEALRNAVKHAAAQRVRLSLRPVDERVVCLEIDDDGRGFDAETQLANAEPGHFGLQLMVDLARRVGARLAVASRPGQGTRIRLELGAA